MPTPETAPDPSSAPLDLPPAVEAALGRLDLALEQLRAAAARRAHRQAASVEAGEEQAAMREDRARLAADLDAALARVAHLQAVQGAVVERLGRAEATVEAVLRDLAGDNDVEDGKGSAPGDPAGAEDGASPGAEGPATPPEAP